METSEIKILIENGIENSEAFVTGGEGKFEATIISPVFEGMTMVKEHQLVYATVNAQIASGELHALSIKAYTPGEWEEKNS
ncbi:MAG: BolA/IbaG family iron-sulfur metabolism protein [Chloroflexota bacterium]